MAARILKHEGRQKRGVAIELGCGAAAIPATAAAWCGFEAYATDIPEMVSASSKALDEACGAHKLALEVVEEAGEARVWEMTAR